MDKAQMLDGKPTATRFSYSEQRHSITQPNQPPPGGLLDRFQGSQVALPAPAEADPPTTQQDEAS
jgi:hypothetical protein